MLDLAFIREHPEIVKKAARDKNEKVDIDEILRLDRKRRKMIVRTEDLRSRRNAASREIARMKKEGKDVSTLIEQTRDISKEIRSAEKELSEIDGKLKGLLLLVPNIAAPDVPVGKGEEKNVVVSHWGERRKFDFEPRPHWELGKVLDILDFERAAKMSGTGFALYKKEGALLERALYNFMVDLHTRQHGFLEVFPPYLVTRATMTGTGQLPKLEEDMYHLDTDDLFLIPTAEVPVTNLHRDEILFESDLPIYYVAYTACFRREAGSYGKETRGMVRVHQFNKVELVKIVKPGSSYKELESLRHCAERVLQLLGLEYRVRLLCTGDLSFAASKCYDIEAWAPGVGKWLEVSSCSNFEDFQARRMNCRYRASDGKVRFVHTLNGSGVALPRTMIALIESYQQRDGSVPIPEVLQPYMGGIKVISRK